MKVINYYVKFTQSALFLDFNKNLVTFSISERKALG